MLYSKSSITDRLTIIEYMCANLRLGLGLDLMSPGQTFETIDLIIERLETMRGPSNPGQVFDRDQEQLKLYSKESVK